MKEKVSVCFWSWSLNGHLFQNFKGLFFTLSMLLDIFALAVLWFYPLILWTDLNQKRHDGSLQVHGKNHRDRQLNVSIIRNTSMLYNMHLFCHLFRWRSSTTLITILASSLDDIVNSQQYPGGLNRGFQRLDLSQWGLSVDAFSLRLTRPTLTLADS